MTREESRDEREKDRQWRAALFRNAVVTVLSEPTLNVLPDRPIDGDVAPDVRAQLRVLVKRIPRK